MTHVKQLLEDQFFLSRMTLKLSILIIIVTAMCLSCSKQNGGGNGQPVGAPELGGIRQLPGGHSSDPSGGQTDPNQGGNGQGNGGGSNSGGGSITIGSSGSGGPYFMILFGSQHEDGDAAKKTHVWGTFLKINGDPTNPAASYETTTISWLPADIVVDDTICIWHCDDEVGKNFDLPTTIKLMSGYGRDLRRFGPYPVKEELWRRAVERAKYLDSGMAEFKGRVDDDEHRRALNLQPEGECNAQLSITDLNGWYDFDGTWGIDATKRAARHLRGLVTGDAKAVEDAIVKRLDISGIPVGFIDL